MALPSIKRIIKETVHYPSRIAEHYTVEMIGTKDGKFHYYEADKPKTEVDLCLYLKTLKGKLTETEIDKMWDLISSHASFQYSEGSSDAEMSHAGPDL